MAFSFPASSSRPWCLHPMRMKVSPRPPWKTFLGRIGTPGAPKRRAPVPGVKDGGGIVRLGVGEGGVPAAQACAEKHPFLIFGALGSDVIPPVRVWAEQNKQLYLYGFTLKRGSENRRRKFSNPLLPGVSSICGRSSGLGGRSTPAVMLC